MRDYEGRWRANGANLGRRSSTAHLLVGLRLFFRKAVRVDLLQFIGRDRGHADVVVDHELTGSQVSPLVFPPYVRINGKPRRHVETVFMVPGVAPLVPGFPVGAGFTLPPLPPEP